MQQVAILRALDEAHPTRIELDGTAMVLVRVGDLVEAFQATCPHAGAPLEQGAVCDGRIVCPWHKAMFDRCSGRLLEPPALDSLRRYPVRVENGRVLASAVPVPEPPPAWVADERVMAVVGAGAAGVAAAAALREFGFGGRVVLVGDEPGLPFDRTALSKFVLQGDMKPADIPPLRPDAFFEINRIERMRGRVVRVDPAARVLFLAGGADLRYHAALLAPGGVPRRPSIPGVDRPGVSVLRTRSDAQRILDQLATRASPQVVIVGGGFIGLEAASAFRAQDLPVQVVMPGEGPLSKALGSEIAGRLQRLHEENGVVFHRGAPPTAVEGDGQDGAVRALRLADGRRIEADLLLMAIGIRPATASIAGLEVAQDGGLDTDQAMRVVPGLFAAGDVARFPFGVAGTRLRVEHWRVAQQQARVAARAMLGHEDARFAQPPFFWTYHYNKRIEVHGHPDHVDRTEIDGDLGSMRFLARQYRQDRLVGLIGCERETELAALASGLAAAP